MAKTRVLIADDSIVFRALLEETLARDPGIEVVGCARNGKDALAQIAAKHPDLVTLDLEMPELDGLAMLTQLRRADRKTRVVVFSGFSERGAKTTVEALARGADDCLLKPCTQGAEGLRAFLRAELVPRIHALTSKEPAPPRAAPPPRPRRSQRVDLVVVASSTGGPPALAKLLSALAADFPVPLAIVQHMPPTFTKLLASHLAQTCRIQVAEAQVGDRLRAGLALIAPGDWHMGLRLEGSGACVTLDQRPMENSVRPAADVLFRCAAECFGGRTLAVVLTGMGEDGLRGASRIHEKGGSVLAQDAGTSVVWGMPGAVARAGICDRVLPIGELAAEITARVWQERVPAPVRR